MPERKHTRASEVGSARATAQLPGLDIDIGFHRSRDGDWEQVSINVRATPSFEAFARLVESANPFVLWAEAVRLMWAPWLLAAETLMLPSARPRRLPEPRED